ncbi:hypothetical protein ACFLZL_01030, partial [Thermodesulfobacteriota bacterium]
LPLLLKKILRVGKYPNNNIRVLSELKKYDSWEELKAKKVNNLINLFEGDKNPIASFGQATGKQGTGQTTILKFLNGGRFR